MALPAAKTLTTNISQAVKNRYYDELFLHIAEKKLVHKQLGQINRTIPAGEGGYGTGVVYWTRWENLPLVTAGQGEGVPTTAIPMTAINVTGSTTQYDAAVSISDIVAKASFGDVMKAAVERLAYNAGLSIDTIVRNVIATAGTQQNAAASAHWTAVPATATFGISELRKAVRTLLRNDTREMEDGTFVAVIHPDTLYDIQGDTTTGGWIDSNKYVSEGANKIYNGEVGKLYGVKFLMSSNGYVRGTGVTTSGSVYTTSVFGRDAFGVTEFQNLRTYVKEFGSAGAGDPTDKVATAGWKTAFGATPLNSNFFVNVNHAVSSTA